MRSMPCFNFIWTLCNLELLSALILSLECITYFLYAILKNYFNIFVSSTCAACLFMEKKSLITFRENILQITIIMISTYFQVRFFLIYFCSKRKSPFQFQLYLLNLQYYTCIYPFEKKKYPLHPSR